MVRKWMARVRYGTREAVALGAWAYAILKLFAFDLDVYVVRAVAPQRLWLLNWRSLILPSVLALLWLVAGHKRFFGWLAYVVFYPFVLLFWRLPRPLWSRWPLLVVLAPWLYTLVRSLRTTLIVYVCAVIAISVIALQRSPAYLVPAMVFLALLLTVRLYRALRDPQSIRAFNMLTQLAHEAREKISGGSLDKGASPAAAPAAPAPTDPKVLPPLYLFHCAADYISRKVDVASRGQKYNRLLILDWLHAFAVVLLVFALEYWALFRIAPQSFASTSGDGFLQFLIYSLTAYTSSSVSHIRPATEMAQLVVSGELVCMILVGIAGVFSIFSARRDSYREGLSTFTKALGEVAGTLEERIHVVHKLTTESLELIIVANNAGNAEFVNFFRRSRGFPVLPRTSPAPTIDVSAAATSAATSAPKDASGIGTTVSRPARTGKRKRKRT